MAEVDQAQDATVLEQKRGGLRAEDDVQSDASADELASRSEQSGSHCFLQLEEHKDWQAAQTADRGRVLCDERTASQGRT